MEFIRAYCYDCDSEVNLKDMNICDCGGITHHRHLLGYCGKETFTCNSKKYEHDFTADIEITCKICNELIDKNDYLYNIKYCYVCDTLVHCHNVHNKC